MEVEIPSVGLLLYKCNQLYLVQFKPSRKIGLFYLKPRNYERVGGGKLKRIEQHKQLIGSRNDRTLKKYSDKFNTMFDFYLKVYRSGLIDFCGVEVKVDFDVNGSDGKFGFREYDNGRFKNTAPVSRHPHVLKGVIIGKKGWGLWVSTWTEGIVDWTFTQEEILQEFDKRGIVIPEPLMIEWDKLICKKKQIRNLNYYNEMLKL